MRGYLLSRLPDALSRSFGRPGRLVGGRRIRRGRHCWRTARGLLGRPPVLPQEEGRAHAFGPLRRLLPRLPWRWPVSLQPAGSVAAAIALMMLAYGFLNTVLRLCVLRHSRYCGAGRTRHHDGDLLPGYVSVRCTLAIDHRHLSDYLARSAAQAAGAAVVGETDRAMGCTRLCMRSPCSRWAWRWCCMPLPDCRRYGAPR